MRPHAQSVGYYRVVTTAFDELAHFVSNLVVFARRVNPFLPFFYKWDNKSNNNCGRISSSLRLNEEKMQGLRGTSSTIGHFPNIPVCVRVCVWL